MVELVVLQTISYTAGAVSVCLGVIYFMLNLRETMRNRRISLTTNLLNSFVSREGLLQWRELMWMQWNDFEDFVRKYDSSVNPDNFALRLSVWNQCEVLGREYRSGAIDLDTLFSVCNTAIPQLWVKFKPILEEYRRRGTFSRIEFENFEYLSYELQKLLEKRDPGFIQEGSYLRAPVK